MFKSRKRHQSNAQSLAQIESRLLNLSVLGRHAADPEDEIGPLGLNLLNEPADPLFDLIFVHGLRGGSRKTWSYSNQAHHYWPREWLPFDVEFKHVRIHSFGYNSDWGETRDSIVNIHDFGKSLLVEIANSPAIQRYGNTPIVFIGHSMGGLVIKKAFILAKQDPAYQPIADRVYGIIFLATPHRGAESATLLKNLLQASFTHGHKPFLSDLERNSGALQSINDEFRHHSADLFLFSFYETLKTSLGVSSALIVSKDSATLGYSNEESALLNANHRSICKFESPNDPNFLSVRNLLITITRDISRQDLAHRLEISRVQLNDIWIFLGTPGSQDDELSDLEDAHVPGSCSWLTSRDSFRTWLKTETLDAPVYLICGQPGSGKTVLAYHVLHVLQDLGQDVAFHLFSLRDKQKSSLSQALRSLAYQMACLYPSVRQGVHDWIQDNKHLDRDNELAIWKKLFVQCIFELSFEKQPFWVLDALDESSGQYSITQLLTKGNSRCPVKIFMTTRPLTDCERDISQPPALGIVEEISIHDTAKDIELYLAACMKNVPLPSQAVRQNVIDIILARSEGCFLWVALVLKELKSVFSEEGIQQVIDEVPQGMNSLYKRAMDGMSRLGHGRHIIKALLIWAVCGARPLTLAELQQALRIELRETITVERLIKTSCSQLLNINKSGQVILIHQTAREFLLGADVPSEFAFNRPGGHGCLADVCLKLLTSDEFKPPRNPKLLQFTRSKAATSSALADYACCFFAEHVRRSSVHEDFRLIDLDKFLRTNVLSWIERLARFKKLHYIVNAAKELQGYLGARAKYQPLIGKEIQRISAWSLDLIRLIVQFGRSLLEIPSAIFWVIPPFCPSSSALATCTKSTASGISVVGVSNTAWSDRLHCLNYHNRTTTSLACGDSRFAVGLADAQVPIYYRTTCHKIQQIPTKEIARLLVFSDSGDLLAISSRRHLGIWNVESGEQVWQTAIRSDCLILKFVEKDTILLVFSKNGNILSISVKQPSIVKSTNLELWDENSLFKHTYTAASISVDLNMIAVTRRGQPIDVYILGDGSYLGRCGRESEEQIQTPGAAFLPVREVLFHPIEEVCRMVALYQDGELALLDPAELSLQVLADADAQTMACTKDGNFLATGDSCGTIKLFEFETLKLQYKILAPGQMIKSMVFSADGLRLFDIRGNQCNVWEPPILVRSDEGDGSSMSEALSLGPTVVSIGEYPESSEITVIAVHNAAEEVFCGKDDGTVSVYSAVTGKQLSTLHSSENSVSLRLLQWSYEKELLASADFSNRVVVQALRRLSDEWVPEKYILDIQIADHTIKQLLFSCSGEYLLVSTAYKDTVFNLFTGNKRVVEAESREARCWTNFTDAERLVEVSSGRISIHSWRDFGQTSQRHDIAISTGLHGDELIKNTGILSRNSDLLIEFEHSGGNRSTAHILLYPTAAFESQPLGSTETKETAVSPSSKALCLRDRVEHFIGQVGKLLIFLDRSFWVSSIDLSEFNGTEYQRHFFIPEEWMSSNTRLIFDVTSKGDVVFAQGGELAIVKKALIHKETVSSSSAVDKAPVTPTSSKAGKF